MMLREWYCDNDPRLFAGKVRLGQLGWTDFYLRNSNLHVKSECDHTSGAIGLKTGLGSLGSLVEEEVCRAFYAHVRHQLVLPVTLVCLSRRSVSVWPVGQAEYLCANTLT